MTLTACPASPDLTPRPAAIRGRRLAGRNSDMMIAEIPSPKEATAAHDEDSRVVDVTADPVDTLIGALPLYALR
ncbi:hypothetical protein GCM10010121_085650 [Streptomyces brasiliensis]|uniref:Uncharacterized protein n=1 Tax=Streptomyces brasiliensis TaxID=1954 RepID=A0A917P514_9ACTN|nr:hypothetical protein GCM10010121_085650 [Streptomyces brasiliensis]